MVRRYKVKKAGVGGVCGSDQGGGAKGGVSSECSKGREKHAELWGLVGGDDRYMLCLGTEALISQV